MDRKQALEMGIAGSLIAVGCLAGAPVTALAGAVAGVGSDWAAELAGNAFDAWAANWLSPRGALNQDLRRAFGRALDHTFSRLGRDFAASDLYRRWQVSDRAAADQARDHLAQLQKDMAHLLDGAAEMPLNVGGSADSLRQGPGGLPVAQQTLRRALADALYGHDERLLTFVAECGSGAGFAGTGAPAVCGHWRSRGTQQCGHCPGATCGRPGGFRARYRPHATGG